MQDDLKAWRNAQPYTSRRDVSNEPPDTDDDLALVFADEQADRMKFCAEWKRWLIWDGMRWERDRIETAFDVARQICRDAAATATAAKPAKLLSAPTVAAVVKLARTDRRIAVTADPWDSHPDLLNTPGGIVDLRNGQMQEHDPNLMLTRITAVEPTGDCPMWLDFLDRITGGAGDLKDYLQRAAGYMLTGHTREHALFFGYGTGANGKSVFANTIRNLMADFAMAAQMETFMATRGEQHPTGLASLRGSRLVLASETEAGRAWAESRIKWLTGGDPVQARFMRADFFEFTPDFKLLVVGNHKPRLSGVDEAIRRRLHLIPFTVTIPEDERDEALPDKLREEWGGILRWGVEGAQRWYECGLMPPECVRLATEQYLDDQDAVGAWLMECCNTDVSENCTETARDLWQSWRKYAESIGEAPGSDKRLSEELQKRGIVKGRGHGGVRLYKKIRMVREAYTPMDIDG